MCTYNKFSMYNSNLPWQLLLLCHGNFYLCDMVILIYVTWQFLFSLHGNSYLIILAIFISMIWQFLLRHGKCCMIFAMANFVLNNMTFLLECGKKKDKYVCHNNFIYLGTSKKFLQLPCYVA